MLIFPPDPRSGRGISTAPSTKDICKPPFPPHQNPTPPIQLTPMLTL
uniref:Uncharacterized protein n=1 Tax=Ciona intestinalis TaxID=7719 RepID=H2XL23_CIOIN